MFFQPQLQIIGAGLRRTGFQLMVAPVKINGVNKLVRSAHQCEQQHRLINILVKQAFGLALLPYLFYGGSIAHAHIFHQLRNGLNFARYLLPEYQAMKAGFGCNAIHKGLNNQFNFLPGIVLIRFNNALKPEPGMLDAIVKNGFQQLFLAAEIIGNHGNIDICLFCNIADGGARKTLQRKQFLGRFNDPYLLLIKFHLSNLKAKLNKCLI